MKVDSNKAFNLEIEFFIPKDLGQRVVYFYVRNETSIDVLLEFIR